MPAKHPLYESKTWNGHCPEPFESWNTKGLISTSAYNASGGNVNIHPSSLKAIIAYCDMVSGTAKHAYGKKPGEYVCAEFANEDEDETYEVVILGSGKVMASTIVQTSAGLGVSPYGVGSSGRFGSAIFFAAMDLFLDDPKGEFETSLSEFQKEYAAGFSNEDKALSLAAVLTDNMYRRVMDDTQTGGVKLDIPANGSIPQLSKSAIERATYAPTNETYGSFVYNKPSKSNAKKTAIKPQDFVGMYPLSVREFSDDEEGLIPQLAKWYVIPHEIVTVCRHLAATTGTYNPMRNIMLRGPAGTGKTEGAKAMAAGLGIPYMSLTCSANTEVFDLIGQIIPSLAKEGEQITGSDVAAKMNMPSEDDILMDPVFAYEMITGVNDESKTSEDCFREMLKRVSAEMGSISSGDKGFEYIDTPLIKALKYGYLCEIQEPTVIMQPGVLVGLNSLLDQDGNMMLPTGEKLIRHPDAVVVVTTNTGYEGCRNMNQSFLSRMSLIVDMDEPTISVRTKRVKNITGCTDDDMVKQLVEIADKVADHCRENQITDGTCGMRELIAWVQSAMILNDPKEAALYTIIASATSDAEARREILDACLAPVFGRIR